MGWNAIFGVEKKVSNKSRRRLSLVEVRKLPQGMEIRDIFCCGLPLCMLSFGILDVLFLWRDAYASIRDSRRTDYLSNMHFIRRITIAPRNTEEKVCVAVKSLWVSRLYNFPKDTPRKILDDLQNILMYCQKWKKREIYHKNVLNFQN